MSFGAKSFHFNIFDKEGKQRCVTGFRANENQNSIKLALKKRTGKKNETQKILVIIYIQLSVEQTKPKQKKHQKKNLSQSRTK